MKLNRWIVLPAAGLAAVIIGVAAVEAAPSPSASPTGSKDYAGGFVDKPARAPHFTPRQTHAAPKNARRQTADPTLEDGKPPHNQAEALKAPDSSGRAL